MTLALATVALLSSFASAQSWDRIAGQRTNVTGKSLTTVVVKTEGEWQSLWAQHTGKAEEKAPAVDFSKEMVVGVFLGERRKAGYSVDCKVVVIPTEAGEVSLAPKADSMVVFYKEVAPKGGFAADVVISPFVLRKVKKAAIVTFERDSLFKAYGAVDTLRVFKDDPRFDR